MTTMEDLAVHIREVCKLPLIMDSSTPSRGNCFFAGVCQQLRRLHRSCNVEMSTRLLLSGRLSAISRLTGNVKMSRGWMYFIMMQQQ